MTRHNLTFTQEGTINLNIQYQGWVESLYNSKDTDILQVGAYGYPYSEEEELDRLDEDIRRVRAYGQTDCNDRTSDSSAGSVPIPTDPTERAEMERDFRQSRREIEQERQTAIAHKNETIAQYTAGLEQTYNDALNYLKERDAEINKKNKGKRDSVSKRRAADERAQMDKVQKEGADRASKVPAKDRKKRVEEIDKKIEELDKQIKESTQK